MSEKSISFKMNPDNPGWIMGWGVLQKKPHDVISMHLNKTEADAEASKLGANFEVQYGSRKLGSNDFINDIAG